MNDYFRKCGYGNVFRVATGALFGPITRPPPPVQYAPQILDKFPADLSGKAFAITGCSRGMGFALAKMVAGRNGVVFLLNRPSSHAQAAVEEIRKVVAPSKASVFHIDCDLADFASVRVCAAQLKQHEALVEAQGLYALVCNAGVMALKDVATKDGYDIQMQSNHLSHFLLAHELFGSLEQAAAAHGEARVIQHSSGARNTPNRDVTADHLKSRSELGEQRLDGGDEKVTGKWGRYQQSKRANMAFAYALADLIRHSGAGKVKSLVAHPGATNSGLQGRTQGESYVDRLINGLAVVTGMNAEDGVLGVAMATLQPDAKNGDFFGPADLTGPAVLLPSEDTEERYPKENRRMFWEASMKATGLAEQADRAWPAEYWG